ncbi:hypothetical protein SPRG_08425 [Saprolegnia parasitica CBS 223.65]|uniref:Uncharacterized protein n=1 Tax=Saprolegnia parasitica (strain CBS 223.65) TaxID=695850 RepID=A0A067CII6_SAPPC|nr:hypothetical protein SPRG_08425 [Saprolegnia parasitica CBS 223.65]KDO26351.1 hypothetical protein SPRG_08425 [Saprolegnia parasitica CBS 223.65]|eukprot:XP_012203049.1 hypothetical protein SPRG_08425 [Saprolegnia parasitica CBS 223.65]
MTAVAVLTVPELFAQIVSYQAGLLASLHDYVAAWHATVFRTLPRIVYDVARSERRCLLHHAIATAKSTHLIRAIIDWRPFWLSGLAIDVAAAAGQLELLQYFHNEHPTLIGSFRALDRAAGHGHGSVVRFLHQFRSEGASVAAMDDAAGNGHLDVVRFLHAHRGEGCTTAAIDRAAAAGHLHVVQFLLRHRSEGFTASAVASARGHDGIACVLARYQYSHHRH